MTDKNFSFQDFERELQKVLNDEPFLAEVSPWVDKRPMTPQECSLYRTACVRYNATEACFELLYNPKFFAEVNAYSSKYIRGIIKHEFYHIILDHLTSRNLAAGRPELARLSNIAQDLTINSYLQDEIPDNLIFKALYEEGTLEKDMSPVKFMIPGKEGLFKDFPLKQSSEYYWNRILKNQDLVDRFKEDTGYILVDHHVPADELTPMQKSVSNQILKKILRESYEKCERRNTFGNINNEIKKEIEDFLRPKINWKKALRRFVNRSVRSGRMYSIKKISRRAPYRMPGSTSTYSANIAVSIDQSGSVSDEMLSVFFAELRGLAKDVGFTVIPFESDIREDKIFEWRKGARLKAERVSCGGTDFVPPVEYVDSKRFDGHIILTDMCANHPGSSRTQILWVTDKQGLDCMESYGFSSSDSVISTEDNEC